MAAVHLAASPALAWSRQPLPVGWSAVQLSPLAPRRTHTRQRLSPSNSVAGDDDNNSSQPDSLQQEREQLARQMAASTSGMTGAELRQLVYDKFNRSYDVRLQKRGRRMYLHVMWKFLEQKSFGLTEEEYQTQLDAVAQLVTMWGAGDTVREAIKTAKWAPGMTIGGGARAFQIPLGVDVGAGGRSGEFNTF